MRLAPGLGAFQTCFLRTGKDHADFRVFQGDPVFLHLPEQGYADHTAGQVVVGAVHHPQRVIGDRQQHEERQEQKAPPPGAFRPGSPEEGADGNKQVIEHADSSQQAGKLKDDTSEKIVQRELPGRVGMAVEEDALLYLPGAGADRSDVGPLPRGEQGIQHRPVKDKMENKEQNTQQSEQDAQPGAYKECQAAEDITEGGEIKIAVKGVRMLPEGFHLHVRAAAVLFQQAGKVFRRGLFPGTSRGTPSDLPADMCDLLRDVGNAVPGFHPAAPFMMNCVSGKIITDNLNNSQFIIHNYIY